MTVMGVVIGVWPGAMQNVLEWVLNVEHCTVLEQGCVVEDAVWEGAGEGALLDDS